MTNKFQDLINTAVDNALSEQRSLIEGLLRSMLWDNKRLDHLVDYHLFNEFFEILNNPDSYYDEQGIEYFKLNEIKLSDFVKRFRENLRENKDRI